MPNSYSKNEILDFQLDGTINMENPFEQAELKKRFDEFTKGNQ